MKKYLAFLIISIAWLVATPASAQSTGGVRTVTGVVTDQEGLPLIGATVLVSGTTKGTSTNAKGEYSIQATDAQTLLFQYIGYVSRKEHVGTRTKINVKLAASKQEIDEIVVIGYGQVKKSDLTGSVANVNMKDIRDVPVVSIDHALQGRIAGADIMSTTGEPGATTSIRIRGTRSISASNEPLIVVDGIIDGIHDLNDLNPSDVESISVLKDASSTAIYGSRGSNGVIVITTKKGNSNLGKPSITFRADVGFSQLPRRLDIMNATEFARYRNDLALFDTSDDNANITINSPLSDYPYPNPEAAGVGTDWIKEISRTAPYQNYDISISGRSEKSSYYGSFGYNDTQGIIDKSGLQRYAARFNIDNQFAKWLKAGLKLSYTYREQQANLANITGTSWWNTAVYLNPLLKLNASFNDLWGAGGQSFNSPRTMIDMCTNDAKRISLNTTGFVEFTPAKGLMIRSQFTYNTYQRHSQRFEPGALPGKKINEGAWARRQEYDETNLLSETTVAYNYKSETGHSFDVLGGYTAQTWNDNNLQVSGSGYTLDELTWHDLGSIPDKQNLSISTNTTDKVKMSTFARVNYNYKGRYYLTATARYDGGSNFASNRKWAFFPSAALKWNISNEHFMKEVKWIDEFSLRLSVGRTGNDAISAYRSLASIGSSTNGYLFAGSQPLATFVSRLASNDLTWETTDMYNIGVDISLFQKRLNVTMEGYYVDTRDLLLWVQVPSQTGFSDRMENAGRTTNKGFELSIESRNIVHPNFQWTTSFTLAHNSQLVKDIASDDFVPAYNPGAASGYMMHGYVKGRPLNAVWGFRDAGTWKNQDEITRNKTTKAFVSKSFELGNSRYQDINHDGILNKDDLCYLGNADPTIYGGLQNTFTIYGFQLGVYFHYSLGGKIYNVTELYTGNGSSVTNQMRYMQNAWHPTRNPESNIPRAGSYDRLPSDRILHDASFLRLKNISVSYTFDMRKITKGCLRDLRISASGENLYLWKKYNGFDPDVSSSSSSSTLRRVDDGAYPKPRTIIFSLQIRY